MFRGALNARASDINEAMKIAAAKALACYIQDDELKANHILPNPLDRSVASAIAKAVEEAAVNSGVSRR